MQLYYMEYGMDDFNIDDVKKTKDDRIQFRCSKETRVDFDVFAAGYTDKEQAIKDALSVWREYPSFFSRTAGDLEEQ